LTRAYDTAVPAARRSIPTLAAIGLGGGLFAALFGVGGGLLIVPLLILFTELPARRAAGTSLAAIGLTAAFGALAYGVLGEVDWLAAIIVGLPAVAGALVGVSLQQRLSSRLLVGLFAAFLVAIAVRLLA
jgi:uncharacterized membrane protein YfcA